MISLRLVAGGYRVEEAAAAEAAASEATADSEVAYVSCGTPKEERARRQLGRGLGGATGSGAGDETVRNWCDPRSVGEVQVLYRGEFSVCGSVSDAVGEEQWEMSISYTPKTSLYLLHYLLRSDDKHDGSGDSRTSGSAEEQSLRFAEDRLLIQLGAWLRIAMQMPTLFLSFALNMQR